MIEVQGHWRRSEEHSSQLPKGGRDRDRLRQNVEAAKAQRVAASARLRDRGGDLSAATSFAEEAGSDDGVVMASTEEIMWAVCGAVCAVVSEAGVCGGAVRGVTTGRTDGAIWDNEGEGVEVEPLEAVKDSETAGAGTMKSGEGEAGLATPWEATTTWSTGGHCLPPEEAHGIASVALEPAEGAAAAAAAAEKKGEEGGEGAGAEEEEDTEVERETESKEIEGAGAGARIGGGARVEARTGRDTGRPGKQRVLSDEDDARGTAAAVSTRVWAARVRMVAEGVAGEKDCEAEAGVEAEAKAGAAGQGHADAGTARSTNSGAGRPFRRSPDKIIRSRRRGAIGFVAAGVTSDPVTGTPYPEGRAADEVAPETESPLREVLRAPARSWEPSWYC